MTKRQLRRLALQTSRYPSWRPVLQDALLEMYPSQFEHAIRWTEEMSKSDAESGYYNPYAIVFRPAAMVPRPFGLRMFGLRMFTTFEIPADRRSTRSRYREASSGNVSAFIARLQREHPGDPLVVAYVTDPSRYVRPKPKRRRR